MDKFREEEHLTVGATHERGFSGTWSLAIKAFCGLLVAYYILYNGLILARLGLYVDPRSNASALLGAVTVIAILFRSARKQTGAATNRLPWYDVLLILAAVVSFGYPVFFFDHYSLAISRGDLAAPQMVLAALAVVALFEASRRVMGLVFPCLALLAIAYLFLTEYTPGLLQMHDIELSRIAWQLYGSESSIFGVAAQVAATIIIIFVIFSAFLQYSRAGEVFINLALALLGHVRGGPAKVAVIASGLFGTFSGSPSANVASTGVVTIPLMKSIGYAPEFAGAVEATASTGGQIMPPVMGAVAFIMSDWLGIPYLSIAIAALVPAVLYYVAIFFTVDAQAVRLGLHGLPREKLPRFWPVLKNGWYWFLPVLLILVALAVFRYDPARSGFLALLSIFPLTFLKGERRFNLKSLSQTAQTGLTTMLNPALACGLAGVLIGVISMTGLGIKLSGLLIYYFGGNLAVLLVVAAFAAFILGMGLPAIPVYMMVVVLLAPALVKMGVPLLSSHMFVFYWGMLSFVTPPVAIAVYVAAAIARSDPLKTGIWAARLAIVAILIPFGMVYNPGLLLTGSPMYLLQTVTLALIGTVAIACGMSGYSFTRVNWFQGVVFAVGGFLLYLPSWWLYLPGLGAVAVTLLWQLVQWRGRRAARRGVAMPATVEFERRSE